MVEEHLLKSLQITPPLLNLIHRLLFELSALSPNIPEHSIAPARCSYLKFDRTSSLTTTTSEVLNRVIQKITLLVILLDGVFLNLLHPLLEYPLPSKSQVRPIKPFSRGLRHIPILAIILIGYQPRIPPDEVYPWAIHRVMGVPVTRETLLHVLPSLLQKYLLQRQDLMILVPILLQHLKELPLLHLIQHREY